MPVALHHEERVVGRKGVEIGQGRYLRITRDARVELLRAHPFARLGVGDPLLQFRPYGREVGRGDGADVDPVLEGREDEMHVRIDQSGHQGPPVQIDDARLRAAESLHVVRLAHGNDAVAADRQRFRAGGVSVHRQDRAAPEDDIGGIGCQRLLRQRRSRIGADERRSRCDAHIFQEIAPRSHGLKI